MFFLLTALSGPRPGADDPDYYRKLIADNLGFIEERCRRAYGIASRWQAEENVPAANRADSLLVELLDHLKADDYRVLREYRGRSSIRRYLEVVIANKVVDLYRKKEGRSRAAEEAAKFGPAGVRLYELVFEDGMPVSEAHRVMVSESGYGGGLDALEAMAVRISARVRHSHAEVSIGSRTDDTVVHTGLRVVKDDDGSLTVPDDTLNPERTLMERHKQAAIQAALRDIAGMLSPQEALMAKMRFNGGMKVREVAAALGLTEKSAYRIYDSMLARCRKMLADKGMGPEDLL